MTTVAEGPKNRTVSHQSWVTLGLILTLLGLRYLVTGTRLLFGEEPSWVKVVFDIGTYLLVTILLILERHSLSDFHITPLAIWMTIVFKPIETLYISIMAKVNPPMAFPKTPSLIIWIIALGTLVCLRGRLFQKGAVQRRDLKWLLLGGFVGLGIVVISAYPLSFEISKLDLRSRNSVLSILMENLGTIPFQIGYAAISEEPVFRGFLWGYLRKRGWRDVWIWLFQAGLFSLAHLYYINTAPISFWFIIPLGALVFGWLACRSRSIATSMVAHGVSNGLGYTIGYLVAIFRL